jgi:hypothetical protein
MYGALPRRKNQTKRVKAWSILKKQISVYRFQARVVVCLGSIVLVHLLLAHPLQMEWEQVL